ncbi:MAG: hypothetical protein K2M06_02670 [Muribaculaceae bacterium]|nr:hypothetical protein [Muribaculaceae bacterium]
MIEIQTNGQSLDLPDNFNIDIEDSNPIFNDRGSQSVPATIPASRRNIKILDFPTRLDAGAEPKDPERIATVVNGPYRRRGTMNITSASKKDGITFNIGFDNSTAYARWREKKLNELDNLPTYTPKEQSGGYRIEWLLDELYSLYRYSRPKIDDLAVFPLAINLETNTENDIEKEYWEILNVVGPHGLSQPGTVNRLLDGELTSTSIPEGYCVSPFVRVWRVLELVFEDMGLTLDGNPFKEDTELARLVVLNNAADSVCRASIRYADLMPDCTVEEFLAALWTRFGLTYNVNFDRQTVKLALIRDIIKESARDVIDNCLAGVPLINYENPRYVKLSAKTSIEGAEPSTERFEDFIKGLNVDRVHLGANVSQWQFTGTQENPKWNGDVRDDFFDDDWDPDRDYPDPEPPEPDYPDPDDRDDRDWDDRGDYYVMRAPSRAGVEDNVKNDTMLAREFITGMWYRLDSSNGKIRQNSSSFFNWDPKTPGLEPLELSSVDEFVPVRRVSNIGTDTGNKFNDYCPTYLFGARHYHSYIKGSDGGDPGDTTPLAFMFAYTKDNRTFGRINPEGEDGQKITLDDGSSPTTSLLFQFRDGLFAKFWAGYDELLRHGSRSIEVDMVFNKIHLNTLDVFTPVMLKSVRCLIDKLNYSLPSGKSVPVSATLRTIQTHGNYDIEKEQNIPAFAAALRHLEWRQKSETFGEGLDTELTRLAAANRYVQDNDYQPHGTTGDYYYIGAKGAVYSKALKLMPIWQSDDTVPKPTSAGQKLTRLYKARIYYDIYEIHDMSFNEGDEDWELDELPLGTSYADAEYSVEIVAVWVSD